MLKPDEFEKRAKEARVAVELQVHCLISLYREAYLAWEADRGERACATRIMLVCNGTLSDIERAAQGRKI